MYAAVDGYVYLLDSMGALLANNSLSGTGFGETRIAALPGSSILVGLNGYIVAMNPITMATLWTSQVTSHKVPVSIIINNGSIYVGTYGSVYNINSANGAILGQFDLSQGGNYPVAGQEVRLSVTTNPVPSANQIIVGVGGYVFGLDTSLNFLWNHQMSYNPTTAINVAGGSSYAYAGINGIISVILLKDGLFLPAKTSL